MKTLITRDGWFFVSNNLSDLLKLVEECGLMMNIDSVEDFLFGEEKFVLLKAIVEPDEPVEIEEFYRTDLVLKKDVIANIHNDYSIDIDVKSSEIHFGGGIYREGLDWKLFIPLEL